MKSNSKKTELNAASLADVAFLLLIFFMVVTTITQDEGLAQQLPRWDTPENTPAHDRNVLEIIVNSNQQLMIEGKESNLNQIAGLVEKHVNNFGNDPNYSDKPELAIVSLHTDRGAHYESYVSVQDAIVQAYTNLENQAVAQLTNNQHDYLSLQTCADKNKDCRTIYNEVKKLYAIRLVEN